MSLGKRELLARGLLWSGARYLFSHLPARDLLLVLNYHRIGNPDEHTFDPGVFSVTGEQLDEQISYLKRGGALVTLEEALAFAGGTNKEKSRRYRVLVTFDDGYLDNYTVAFPILRSHGAQGVFFLITSIVGSAHVPWWDHVAYLVKTARRRRFSLRYPAYLAVDLDKNGVLNSLIEILNLYYSMAGDSDPERFMRDLEEETEGANPPAARRRFLSWDEAREMADGGMAIGSHTHTHRILSQLGLEEQGRELAQSRALLRDRLGIEADALAYPVGTSASFSSQTQALSKEAGYRAAFSFQGGTNAAGEISSYNLRRVSVGHQSWTRFRVQAEVCRLTGQYWP